MARALLLPSNLILLAANLVPLIGVVFWGWDAFVLMMLYWLETAVIAFWTVVRVALLSPAQIDAIALTDGKRKFSALGMAMFLTLHAGIFMAVHFLFLWALFAGEWSRKIDGVRAFVEQMVIGTGLWLPLFVLFATHGGLMLFDASKPRLLQWFAIAPRERKEPETLGAGESLLFGLYIRVFVMQISIIIGAWFALLIGTAGAALLLIAVKTAVDLSFQILAQKFHAAWLAAKAMQAKSQD